MSLPLWQQVPKRGETIKRDLVSATTTRTRGLPKEVCPLRSRGEIEAKSSGRSLRKTLIVADIGLTSSTETGLELFLGGDEPRDNSVLGGAVESDSPHHI